MLRLATERRESAVRLLRCQSARNTADEGVNEGMDLRLHHPQRTEQPVHMKDSVFSALFHTAAAPMLATPTPTKRSRAQ